MASAYNITPEGFSKRWKRLRHYVEELGRDPDSIGNAVVTMFTYLSKDRAKTRLVAECTLAPVLGWPREELGRLLPLEPLNSAYRRLEG